MKALSDIATIVSGCSIRESLYQRRYESNHDDKLMRESANSHITYRDALRSLYVKILSFQATSICFLSKNTLSRTMADMVKWDDWKEMLAEIKEQEGIFKSIGEQWRDMKYEEECKLNNERHEQKMRGIRAFQDEVSRLREVIEKAQADEERKRLLEWLFSVDPSTNYNYAHERNTSSRGDWLVKESSDFKNWEKAPNSLLWLHGKGIIPLTRQLPELTGICSWFGEVLLEVWAASFQIPLFSCSNCHLFQFSQSPPRLIKLPVPRSSTNSRSRTVQTLALL